MKATTAYVKCTQQEMNPMIIDADDLSNFIRSIDGNNKMAAKKRSGHVTKYDVVEYDISQVEPKIIEVV